MTKTEEAGQYYAGNRLYAHSRKVRGDDDGVEDPAQQASAVILGGNIYRRHNERMKAETQALQDAYLNHPTNAMFAATRPREDESTVFRTEWN